MHAAPRRSRRHRHQDRAARQRRRHARVGPAVPQGRARARHDRGRVLPRVQSRQAVGRRRLHDARRAARSCAISRGRPTCWSRTSRSAASPSTGSTTRASPRVNPRLVYASITGFGQDGPYADRAGYDFIIQGMCGFMSVTGERDDLPGGGPQKAGIAITDLMTGMYATVAIQAALAHRDRTGQGQWIDTCLFDSAVAMMAVMNMNYLVTGTPPGRAGNAHQNIVPVPGVRLRRRPPDPRGRQRQPVREVLRGRRPCRNGRATRASRRTPTACAIATCSCRSSPTVDARRARSATGSPRSKPLGVPCGPINRLDQVFADPQVARARHAVRPAASARGPRAAGRVRRCAFSATPPALRAAAAAARRAHGAGAARAARARTTPSSRALAARGVIEMRRRRSTGRMTRPDAQARVLDRLRRRSRLRRARASRGSSSRSRFRSSTSTSRWRAHEAIAKARSARRASASSRRTDARTRCALRARPARRRTTSSSKAAASPRSRALVAGDVVCAVLVGRAAVQARRHRARRRSASGPTARSTASRAACPRPTCATPRPRRSTPAAARALARSARARRLERRLRARTRCSSSRSRRGRPAASTTRSCIERDERLGEARIRLRLDGHRRRADRGRAVRAHSRDRSSAASGSCAARTTRSPESRALAAGLLYGLGGCILGVLWLAAPALARCGGRRWSRASSSAA